MPSYMPTPAPGAPAQVQPSLGHQVAGWVDQHAAQIPALAAAHPQVAQAIQGMAGAPPAPLGAQPPAPPPMPPPMGAPAMTPPMPMPPVGMPPQGQDPRDLMHDQRKAAHDAFKAQREQLHQSMMQAHLQAKLARHQMQGQAPVMSPLTTMPINPNPVG